MSKSRYSSTYAEARVRFKVAAAAIGASVFEYSVDAPCEEKLAIDVAITGVEGAPTVVTSSAVHGVEGFFGSAVQHALLNRLGSSTSAPHLRHVLIHGVNPFGFSRLRRFNEDNVDLNRNFLAADEAYQGAPGYYALLDGLLNPQSPPYRFEPFRLKAVWNIWRYGFQALKQSVAGGQYDYPRGLFYGGDGPCRSTQIIRNHCSDWIGSSDRVVHIDFHSGLGTFGNYKLLVNESAESACFPWYVEAFGSDNVEPLDSVDGTAYRVAGMFGKWMQSHFASCDYRFVGAEFGTYDVIRVLAAIRAENRSHHHADENSKIYRAAKAELLECFCPKNESWRQRVVDAGLKIINQGERALLSQ